MQIWVVFELPYFAVFLCVLGSDGSGKSSVIGGIRDRLQEIGHETRYLHLRPGIGRKSGEEPTIDPHGKPARGFLVSVLKMGYLLADYSIGYWLIVRPALRRSVIVIFDRYYHDLLVDPKRYRYGGPMWLARLIGRLIPKPDLWVLLDAPAEVLQERKQEVLFEETARQRREYLKLIKGMKNGIVIDASQDLDDVVADVNAAILKFMADRTEKRLAQ